MANASETISDILQAHIQKYNSSRDVLVKLIKQLNSIRRPKGMQNPFPVELTYVAEEVKSFTNFYTRSITIRIELGSSKDKNSKTSKVNEQHQESIQLAVFDFSRIICGC